MGGGGGRGGGGGGGGYLQMRLTNSVFEGACKEGWLGMGHPRGDNELSVWLRTR